MKTAAVIAEYNPFHSGHAYHIDMTKKAGGADFVIALMSPDFVQRGMPAFVDKYTRTRMALEGGVDLVLEMPVRTALSAAGDFALGSVRILNALGCVDLLSFGSKCGDLSLMGEAAHLLANETSDFQEILRKGVKNGLTYSAAREKALRKCFPSGILSDAELSGLVSSPNNILALEYLRALDVTCSSMKPFSVTRKGSDYHGRLDQDNFTFPSAEGIRKAFADQPGTDLSSFIPPAALAILKQDLARYGSWNAHKYDILLEYALSRTDLSKVMDMSPEIQNRIHSLLGSYHDAVSFADTLKTKQYTLTRICRTLSHVFLGLYREGPLPGGYVRLLGFRRGAGELLRKIGEHSSIPVITKPASAKTLLQGEALSSFEEDIRCSGLYRLLQDKQKRENEYTRSPIII